MEVCQAIFCINPDCRISSLRRDPIHKNNKDKVTFYCSMINGTVHTKSEEHVSLCNLINSDNYKYTCPEKKGLVNTYLGIDDEQYKSLLLYASLTCDDAFVSL